MTDGTMPQSLARIHGPDPIVDVLAAPLRGSAISRSGCSTEDDGRERVHAARVVGLPRKPRGLDWAMTNGAAGPPTTLCAVVVNIVPSHRGTAATSTAADEQHRRAHGPTLIAPRASDRVPSTIRRRRSALRALAARDAAVRPVARTHERLGGTIFDPARAR